MPEMKSPAALSRDDIEEAIRGLGAADWRRLRKVASLYARAHKIEADDLLQLAFERALNGTRKCPPHVDVVRFLAEAMRSIASGETEKHQRQPKLVPIANHGDAEQMVDPPDPAADPESAASTAQQVAKLRDDLLGLFSKDEMAQLLLEGMLEGMQGEELRELVEIDKTAYESKRRAIRRRIEKKYPKGFIQ